MSRNHRTRLKEQLFLDGDKPSLLETVFKFLANNLSLISQLNTETNTWELKDDVIIPNEICDRFLQFYQSCSLDINDSFINIFKDTNRTPLKFVSLRNGSISDDGMRHLLNHKLISLSLWYCEKLTHATWQHLVANGSELKNLELGKLVDVLKNHEPNEKTPLDFQLALPKLKRLVLNGVALQSSVSFSHLHELSYLDLTACLFADFSLESLIHLPQLQTLILFNVWPLEREIPTICKLKNLRMLDISLSKSMMPSYSSPNKTLEYIVESLPLLEHLDISGTNLAGTGVAQQEATCGGHSSDIPGLASRVERPLKFLGLYDTTNSACRRHDIPALTIAGDANEDQILLSAIMYQDRNEMLTKVLNDLYHLLRFENCTQIDRALRAVLIAMDKHISVKHIQISGSATLFYIVKSKEKVKFGSILKNHIIRTLLNGMSAHLSDDTMMRNGCLTLCQFSIPSDVLFEYERLVRILLHGVSDTEQSFVQRIAIYLLNSLACQVDGNQKLFLGNLGAISTMLNLINDRLNRKVFDDVMEVAWSTMWNVTDETAVNCERFLDGKGMEYFLGCLRCFPDKDELLRNMMGLLGNVAEVKNLRHRLMTSEYIAVFSELLFSNSDGIEVSYNAAGVLAHIASDGPDIWTIQTPSREDVLNRMYSAIDRWNLETERNINYRSFEPILGLIKCYETPACQIWAVWALANLTKVYPEKYCKLVEQEHGVKLLMDLMDHMETGEKLKELAQIVLNNIDQNNQKYMEE